MITIKNTQFSSNLSLAAILGVQTKAKILAICDQLDLFQKFGLVLTYEDFASEQWHMLMPDCVREAFAPKYQPYLDIALRGAKLPSKKQIRMMMALNRLMGDDE